MLQRFFGPQPQLDADRVPQRHAQQQDKENEESLAAVQGEGNM